MTKRILLLVGCALFLGGASAQEVPQIARGALWNIVEPQIRGITQSQFLAMFNAAAAPAISPSSYRFVATFDILGNVYKAEVSAGNAVYAWGFAASQGAAGDSGFKCFVAAICTGSTEYGDNTATTATNDYTFKFYDGFSQTYGTYYVASSGTGDNMTWQATISSAGGDGRGASSVSQGGAGIVDTTCGGSWSGSGTRLKTEPEAKSAMTQRLNALSERWAMRAPACVPYHQFVESSSSIVPAWQFALVEAKRRNLNPLRFFDISGIEVIDDTPAPPDPNAPPDADGDGIPNGEDQYPYDPTNTPPTNQWDVAPGDEETQCSIVNIPCNLRKLFVPQVDWAAEWQEMKDVMAQKMPFAYVSWLGAAESASSQDIGIDPCAPIQYDNVEIDWCNSAAMIWWKSYGVNIAFAVLYIGYLMSVIGRVRA